jgi:hypothetical protein
MKITVLFYLVLFFLSCNNAEEKTDGIKDTKISLWPDSLNVVHLKDTLVIYESTCRGCAYESSTHFSVSDSMNIIKMEKVISIDNNSTDMAGGSTGKQIVLLPLKTGTTSFKLYKFWKEKPAPKDSLQFKLYTIEVQN